LIKGPPEGGFSRTFQLSDDIFRGSEIFDSQPQRSKQRDLIA
jgi:hypothetical protein